MYKFRHPEQICQMLLEAGLVAGVDFSPSMVAMARRRNRTLVDQGLIDLRQGDSLRLPYENNSFDRAWSVHTVYFWHEPVAHMPEPVHGAGADRDVEP